MKDKKRTKTQKKKRSVTDIIIKILTACCIISAVILIAVLSLAFIGGEKETTAPSVSLGDVTDAFNVIDTTEATTEPTTTTTTKPVETTEKPKNLVYATEDVNIRRGPSTDDEKVGILATGNAVEYISVNEDNWYEVIFAGETCYIFGDYLTKEAPAEISRQMVNPISENWNFIVVNTTRQIPASFVPKLAYVCNTDEELDARVAPYFQQMYDDALKDGIELTPYSGYRTYEGQRKNFENLTQDYIDAGYSRQEAQAKAATQILPPGTSEHNLGLAMDIVGTSDSFADSDAYAWLKENAHKYGFIERYTAEKQEITGIIPEPWHWRYVGKDAATEINESGLCLEEYLEEKNIEY